MANPRRGEIDAVIDGRTWTLCLTLGALCELEAAFGAGDLRELGDRFASGRLSARDLIRIVAAGLRGAGEPVTDDDVAAMKAEGGAAGFAGIAARLLAITFGADPAGAVPDRPTQEGTAEPAPSNPIPTPTPSPGTPSWPSGSAN